MEKKRKSADLEALEMILSKSDVEDFSDSSTKFEVEEDEEPHVDPVHG